MSKETVIVVGAGLSGLSAAILLQERDVDVVVLEANDRVGGRTLTVTPSSNPDVPQFGWVDLGASYVGPTQDHVLRICKNLGCQTYLCRDNHDIIHYSRGKRCRYTSSWPNFWWSNPFAAWDLRSTLLKLQEMVDQVPEDCPWRAANAVEWDRMTVKEFLDKHCWTRDAKEFLEAMTVINNTAEDHEVSLLFFLWYLRQGQGVNRIWRIKGGAQERKIIGGSQQLSIKMAQKLGEKIHLKKPVVQVRHMDDGAMVKTLDGTVFSGSYVVLAIPPITHLKIHFDPPLPSLRRGLIQRCPMGLVIKWIGFYRTEFWVENGLNGFVTCMDGIEVVGNVGEDYKPGISLYGLICFVYGQHAIRLAEMNENERKNAICASLAKYYDSPNALKVVHIEEKIWAEEPYIGGCYTSYYPPGVLSQYGAAIREPIGNRIYLAGTETALKWTGYMNGAIEAGERAARQVLHAQGKISSSEVWAEEPKSEEVPVLPLELPWLEKYQPNIGSVISAAVFITSLGLAFFHF